MSTYGELWEAFEDAEIAESETTAMACIRAVRERDEARAECERLRSALAETQEFTRIYRRAWRNQWVPDDETIAKIERETGWITEDER